MPNFGWLHQQLDAAGDARGVVLVTHHPPVFPPAAPEGPYDPADYERLFAEHNITMMVHSHLEHWSLTSERGTTHLQCGTFQSNRFYSVVTIDGSSVSVERCHFSACEPVAPPRPPGLRL